MAKKFDIAVVGATGAVGQTMLSILKERNFPVRRIFAIASSRTAKTQLRYGSDIITVHCCDDFDFREVQLALFSAGSSVSAIYAVKAAKTGCIVIDNTSAFRYDDDVPLIIPEVNAHALSQYQHRNIVANPNCATIQMLVALKPIYDAVGIERINVATYQSVSGTGKKAIEELKKQTMDLLQGKSINTEVYPTQIAFNLIPHIGERQECGYTQEEMKMIWETQKILEDKEILVNPTAVRVPVLYGHSEAVHIETRKKISTETAKKLLSNAPGVTLVDYPTPAIHASGNDAVFVGRIREDISHPRGLNLFIVADNLRKGAALNAVQIAEIIVKRFLERL